MGDGGGHAVLNPKQPKPPIQKQLHLQPTPQTPFPWLKPLETPLASPSRLLFFKFVFPNHSLSTPECPFEVANTLGGTITNALIENVFVAWYMDLTEVKRTGWRGRGVRNLERGLGLYMCYWGPWSWWWLRRDYRWNDRRLKSHQLESERIVNYFVKERFCFCIHHTGPCNIASIRNRSTYLLL